MEPPGEAADWKVHEYLDTASNRFGDDPLRTDDHVIKEVQRWWFAARKDDRDADEKLDKHEYSAFYERIVYVSASWAL
jgi:hypothetical protein